MRTCPTSKFNVTHFHWINFFINSKHLLVVTDSSLSTLFNITSHWNFWKTNPSSQNTATPSFISWSFLFVYNKWRGSRSRLPLMSLQYCISAQNLITGSDNSSNVWVIWGDRRSHWYFMKHYWSGADWWMHVLNSMWGYKFNLCVSVRERWSGRLEVAQ